MARGCRKSLHRSKKQRESLSQRALKGEGPTAMFDQGMAASRALQIDPRGSRME